MCHQYYTESFKLIFIALYKLTFYDDCEDIPTTESAFYS